MMLAAAGGRRRWRSSRPGPPRRPMPKVIAVARFGPSGGARLGDAPRRVSEMLASALAGDSGVRAASHGRVAAVWEEVAPEGAEPGPEAAVETGRRVGAGRVIEGAVAGDSSSLSVTGSLRDALGGALLARASVAGPATASPPWPSVSPPTCWRSARDATARGWRGRIRRFPRSAPGSTAVRPIGSAAPTRPPS